MLKSTDLWESNNIRFDNDSCCDHVDGNIINYYCDPNIQKLLIELEDKEVLLKPLENELQRQIEELCRIMKEGSHFEKQSLSEVCLLA